MNNTPDIKQFHESTSREFKAVKDRVRNLIGNTDWARDGRHKEVVLANVIKRFLPKRFNIGTGYIVAKSQGITVISDQIDLIIYENSFPLLFSQSDFIITTPAGVRALIEVKTNLQKSNIQKVIDKANKNGKFIYKNQSLVSNPMFNGIFSYEGYEKSIPKSIKIKLRTSALKYLDDQRSGDSYLVNNICVNNVYFVRYNKAVNRSYSMYEIPELSFSYFIGNLIYYLMKEKDMEMEKEQAIWFPIDKGQHTVWNITLNE